MRVVDERHPLARVFERGPDDVLDAGLLRRCAMFVAWAISFSAEKCSQKLVTQNAPYAPSNALFRLLVIEVRGNNVGTELGQLCRLIRV